MRPYKDIEIATFGFSLYTINEIPYYSDKELTKKEGTLKANQIYSGFYKYLVKQERMG